MAVVVAAVVSCYLFIVFAVRWFL